MEIEAHKTQYTKVHIKEGLYHAEVLDIRDISDGEYGSRLAVVFNVYPDVAKDPVQIALVAYKSITPNSKLTKTLTPIDPDVQRKEKIDTDDYIGTYCRVLVDDYKTRDGLRASAVVKVLPRDEHTAEFIANAKAAPDGQSEIVEVKVD